jgi:hypothetical protein
MRRYNCRVSETNSATAEPSKHPSAAMRLRPISAWAFAALSAILILVPAHQSSFVAAVSQLDHGHGYAPLSPSSDESHAAAYMRKYHQYGRRTKPQDGTSTGSQQASQSSFEHRALPIASQPQKIDIHVVAHTHDDVGWLSTPFA